MVTKMHKTKNYEEKRWIIKSAGDSAKINEIAQSLNLHPIVAKLLYSRGYTDVESARIFVNMESEILCDPFMLKDMHKGIDRIKSALDKREKITIYGDYDVDGVTSVCTLYLYLKSKGASVNFYIPNRTGEGYGVSTSAIDNLKANGTSLIITVDTGITANDEVEYAKSIGIDFVITDHHECRSELPDAVALINPHRPDCPYPFKELAGVGVVFKLISAYEEKFGGATRKEAALKIFNEFADLVAIGTIADVMPIRLENRIIVGYGLKMIENTKRPGLIALMNASLVRHEGTHERNKKRKKITSGFIGYTVAPRINAAGRVRSATIAVKLFLEQNADRANSISLELCQANKERQNEENTIMQEAADKLANWDTEQYPVIVLDADHWHHGVIGIVASRITEKYSRPCILISFEGNENENSQQDVGKGSGRSIKGLNLVDALVACSDKLVKYGGHELAAGLSVTRENLPDFIEKINEYARKNLNKDDMVPTLDVDCEIKFSDLSFSLAQQLQKLEPYGVGNPQPAFVIHDTVVGEISAVSEGRHTRISLTDGKNTVSAMYFSNSPESLGIYNGDKVDVVFNVDINEYLGRRSVQLIVKDIRPSHTQSKKAENEVLRFEEIWNGAPFGREENILPSRDDFAYVYRFLNASIRNGNDTFEHRELCSKLSSYRSHIKINYIKLKIIIKVFTELNLIGIDEFKNEVYRFTIHYSTSKTELDKSNLLRRLRLQQRKDF
jgi:single-stranded-DNA-specific exonuclease